MGDVVNKFHGAESILRR